MERFYSLYDTISERPKKLPWQYRTSSEWLSLVRPHEASRLFFASGLSAETIFQQRRQLQRWCLLSPLSAFGSGHIIEAMTTADKIHQELSEADFDQINAFVEKLTPLFNDTKLLEYLLTLRKVDKGRRELRIDQPAKLTDALNPVSEIAVDILGFSKHEKERVISAYHDLIMAFIPKFVKRKYNPLMRMIGDYDDAEQKAYLRISEASIHYYWEPFIINPVWTVSRFIRYAATHLYDEQYVKSDANDLFLISRAMPRNRETGELLDIRDGFNTEDRVLSEIDNARVIATIYEILPTPQDAQLFIEMYLLEYTYNELSERYGQDIGSIKHRMTVARDLLRQNSKRVFGSDFDSRQVRPSNQASSLWENLYSDHEYFRELFTRKGMLLIEFHYQLFAKVLCILEAAPAEEYSRQWLIDKAHAEFPHIQKSSVRRHIAMCADLLQGFQHYQHNNPGRIRVTRNLQWHQEKASLESFLQRQENTSYFSEFELKLIQLFYLGAHRSQQSVAADLGVHESVVSRTLNRIRMKMIQHGSQ